MLIQELGGETINIRKNVKNRLLEQDTIVGDLDKKDRERFVDYMM